MVELSYPSNMTADDLKDFEDTLAITIRRLRRPLAAQVAPSFIGQLLPPVAHQPPVVPEYAHHSPPCAEQLAVS